MFNRDIFLLWESKIKILRREKISLKLILYNLNIFLSKIVEKSKCHLEGHPEPSPNTGTSYCVLISGGPDW